MAQGQPVQITIPAGFEPMAVSQVRIPRLRRHRDPHTREPAHARARRDIVRCAVQRSDPTWILRFGQRGFGRSRWSRARGS
jgi:hypothetical protein